MGQLTDPKSGDVTTHTKPVMIYTTFQLLPEVMNMLMWKAIE